MAGDIDFADYPLKTHDKIRYGDTDRQGHVNNAVFATFLESGRVEILYDEGNPLADPSCAFVIAQLVLNFRAEVTWPGMIEIGTRVASVGRSSVKLEQALFQGGRCVAVAETTIVQMDEATRRSSPLSAAAVERLSALKPAGQA